MKKHALIGGLDTPKRVSLAQMEARARAARARGKRMVFTNGCFDLLHPGHVGYLEMARRLGDYLVVGLNADVSVRRIKGPARPINPEAARARVLAGLACVDYVVIFRSQRVTPLLRRLKPEIYVKGGDYTLATLDQSERRAVECGGGAIRILPVWKGFSTTAILKKVFG
ncbi:MAG: D-glycero-beta-D-manno-heptose 1-phosphate adenylyltransferase [Verrucomicrobiae bacterium]|nr:D-glycero-beta-D-manno-heptose 1-phosphate adenylyltransferase [Verrucomicrobiae bacterium]